jgi:guanylate kinase
VNKANGLLVVLSSPSGGGKTTVIKQIIANGPPDYLYSISITTRPMRKGEIGGKDYWFVTPEEFQNRVERGELIEYERVHDWYYGTPKTPIVDWIRQGKVVFLDIDVYGALELKQQFGDTALLIFLMPPSTGELIDRLVHRSTETERQIARRLERLPEEMKKAQEFDYVVVNAQLDETTSTIQKLIENKRNILQ